jgi:fast type myosin-binding protein C
VHVRTSDFDTVFFVRQAARSDSGEYELSVLIENMKDTAIVRIRVVGARRGVRGWGEGRRDEDR